MLQAARLVDQLAFLCVNYATLSIFIKHGDFTDLASSTAFSPLMTSAANQPSLLCTDHVDGFVVP